MMNSQLRTRTLQVALSALGMACVMSGAQPGPAARSAGKPAAEQSKDKAASVSIPAGAVEIAPGTYRYTDPQGQKWIYWQTPFGVAHSRQKDESAYTTTAPDAEGKQWMYRVTPFGIARFPQPSEAEAAQERQKVVDLMTATEDGDLIRFTRTGPFGTYKWTRKKTELDEMERSAWQRDRVRQDRARERE